MLKWILNTTNEIRVLLIEDNDDDALLILRQLGDHGFRVTADRVDHLDALRGHLANNKYDVIISDYSLPSFTATHALQCVRDMASETPFVIVSGKLEEDTAIALVKQGASDFLNKDRLGRAGIAVETVIHHREVLMAKRAAEADQNRAEERLRHAEKMEAVGHLAGGVAHDFNNLLSIILNYADFVIDDLEHGDPNPEDVLKIKAAAERGASLTRHLLALSRKEPIKAEVLDLRTVVEEMRMFLDPTIGEEVELLVETAHGLWSVEADRGRIDQVLMNLAVNARDAMPRGGTLTIETSNVDVDEGYAAVAPGVTPGRYVCIRVSDTGTGMEPAVAQRIFDPFFTTKPAGEGTGLGLATVQGIVAQAGGAVHVYSEPDFGTSMSVLLPATDLTKTDDRPAAVRVLSGTETVLVVEDEEGIREVVRRILGRHGYEVVVAPTGADAVAIAGDPSRPIDLVITDVVMPGMGGREITNEIGRLRPGIKVLYMSGYGQAVLDSRGRLEPGRALLQKPFSDVDLLTIVREAIEGGVS